MIDDPTQLDLIDRVCPPRSRPAIRVCLELDAGYPSGARRAPRRAAVPGAHTRRGRARWPGPSPTASGSALVGMMAYEGQIAGVGNAVGAAARRRLVRAMQRRSAAELAERRTAAVAAVRDVADLEFVNGGGTGSLETTAAEAAVTEVAAGSGLLGPGLFDHYRGFHPAAASFFVLPVVRRPGRRVATLAGGGWIASGPPGRDRLPVSPTRPACGTSVRRDRARCRRRCAARPPTGCGSGTRSGCGTPSPANRPSI